MNTPYFTKAENLAQIANVMRQYNYGASEYRGFLAIADTPTLDGWYWATEIGTYTNAGNLVIVANKINMIEKDGSTFRLYDIDVPATEVVDGFLSTETTKPGSANNDRLLNEKIETAFQGIKLLEQPDGFYLTDASGNVIAKVTADGIQSVAFLNKEGEDLAGVSTAIKVIEQPDGFYFVDNLGFIVCKITADGFQSAEYLDKQGVPLRATVLNTSIKGKEFYTIGDSLSAANIWQSKLVELTNSTFNAALNNSANLSVGGTRTGGVNTTCGQWRAKLLFELGVNPEVIFIENINDAGIITAHPAPNGLGTINDEPFMLLNIIIYPTTFNTQEDIYPFLDNGGFSSYLGTFATIDRKIGSGIRIPYLDGSTTKYREYIFDSKNVANWTTRSFWISESSGATIYKVYKGLIEYLKSKFPTALIYWFAPTRLSIQTVVGGLGYNSAFWNADGSFNMNAFKADPYNVDYKKLVDAQKDICAYYSIPFLNVNENCGINPLNYLSYYPPGDAHPLPIGYEKWGETVARLIQ